VTDTVDTLVDFFDKFLEIVSNHETRLPTIAFVEVLYALTNTDNTRLKRQESLYMQIINRIDTEMKARHAESKDKGWFCACLDVMSGMLEILTKNEFDERDFQYPLLLTLSLSHTSPREVGLFLDLQTPQYNGDFGRVLNVALLEYDDLLLPNQIKEAQLWLTNYQAKLTEIAEFQDIFLEDADIAVTEPIEVDENRDNAEELELTNESDCLATTTTMVKPSLTILPIVQKEVYEALKTYFDESEQAYLETLLKGEVIDRIIEFHGKAPTLIAFFRDMIKNKVVKIGHQQTALWLNTYFIAYNQYFKKVSPITESTAMKYFEDESRTPHYSIDVTPILLKISKKT
jgi:hypothetical protein